MLIPERPYNSWEGAMRVRLKHAERSSRAGLGRLSRSLQDVLLNHG